MSDSNLTKVKEIPLRSQNRPSAEWAWIASMADADEDGRDQRDFLRMPEILNGITRESCAMRRGSICARISMRVHAVAGNDQVRESDPAWLNRSLLILGTASEIL